MGECRDASTALPTAPEPRMDGEASVVTAACPSWTSASGQKRKSRTTIMMSVIPPKAEVDGNTSLCCWFFVGQWPQCAFKKGYGRLGSCRRIALCEKLLKSVGINHPAATAAGFNVPADLVPDTPTDDRRRQFAGAVTSLFDTDQVWGAPTQ